jgi:hypothetical protein
MLMLRMVLATGKLPNSASQIHKTRDVDQEPRPTALPRLECPPSFFVRYQNPQSTNFYSLSNPEHKAAICVTA